MIFIITHGHDQRIVIPLNCTRRLVHQFEAIVTERQLSLELEGDRLTSLSC